MDAVVERAVAILRAGGVVAIPTETVYGLAADAANPEAVARIYAIKGRPADHPLIVHVASAAQLGRYAIPRDNRAAKLGARFWPGPLTLVVPRAATVGDFVTGGQDTVAVRVPNHPLALQILAAFGGALAAPSANRFGRISPTTAAHVAADLGTEVDLIVDGGPARIGVESTIVDLTAEVAGILRAGAIGPSALGDVLGASVVTRLGGPVRAPGTLASHYAPRARLVLVGVLTLPNDAALAARELYATLRALDAEGYDTIVTALPPDDEAHAAVRDRLLRAAN